MENNVLDAETTVYLDRSLNELRQRLLKDAASSANNGKIEKQDIDNAIENLVRTKTFVSWDKKMHRMLYLLSITGVFYSMIGIFVFVFQNIDFNPHKDIGLLIFGIGMSLTMMSILFNLILKNRRKPFIGSDNGTLRHQFLLVQKWKEIENLVYSKMEIKNKNFQYMLSNLIEKCEGKIPMEELANLVTIRNMIVHENIVIPKREIFHAIELENQIIDLLSNK